MTKPKDDWECEFGPYHIFDPENISICIKCADVHFYCANCEKEIAQMALDECPRESRALAFELATMGDGEDDRQPA